MKSKTTIFMILISGLFFETALAKTNLDYCKPLIDKFTKPMGSFSFASYRNDYQYGNLPQEEDKFDIQKDSFATLDSNGRVNAINSSNCAGINCVINAKNIENKGELRLTEIEFKAHQWKDFTNLKVVYKDSKPSSIKLGTSKGSEDYNWKQSSFNYTKDGKCIPGEITYDSKKKSLGTVKNYQGKVSTPSFCKNLHEMVKDINNQMAAINKCKNLYADLKGKFSELKNLEKREENTLEDDIISSIRSINEGIENAGSGLTRRDNYKGVFGPHSQNAPLWEIGDAYRWRCQVFYPNSFFEDKELWNKNPKSGLYSLDNSIFSASKSVIKKSDAGAVKNN